jgi:hypothetical protein
MKYCKLIFIITGLFICQSSFAFESEVNISINKFNLRNCVSKRCIQLTADSARSGYFSPIMKLANVRLKIYNGSKNSQISSATGYLDFEQNLVSFRINNKKEVTLNLKNLTTKEYLL